jgi:hypothetical protein
MNKILALIIVGAAFNLALIGYLEWRVMPVVDGLIEQAEVRYQGAGLR